MPTKEEKTTEATPKTEPATSPEAELAPVADKEASDRRIKELEAELARLKSTDGAAMVAVSAKELAPLPDASRALEPRNLPEAKALAVVMADARVVVSAEVGLVLLMRGRPLGLDAMTCATKLFAIENKSTGLYSVGMYSDLILALTRQHRSCEYIELVETTATKCVMVGKRKGGVHETRITWDIERAKRADLLDRGDDENAKKRSNWNRYPENMLRARASSEICKIVCPEATMGIDSFEVLQDERDRARTVEVDQATGQVIAGPGVVESKSKPSRDYAREVDELKLAISTCKTKAEKEEIVRRIGAADLPEAYLTDVRAAYTAKFAPKKAEREPGEEG